MINTVKDKVAKKFTDLLLEKFLKNAGIDDMISNPKNYKVILDFDDDGDMTIRISKKR